MAVVHIFQFEVNIGWADGGTCYACHATSLLGLASYSSTYYKGCGLTQGWYPDINTNANVNNTGFNVRQGYLIRNPDPNGRFQCAIPMRHIRFSG